MSPKTKILLTGITGYIGGAVFTHLLKYADYSSYEVTALVRSSEKAKKLKKLDLNVVVGAHDDEKLMESLAAETDIVIATSGTGVLGDLNDLTGTYATDLVYDDANPAQIESIPDTAVHRNVDLLLVNADKEGYVKTYIILPSTIYGVPTGILVDRGIQNIHSIQIPTLIRASLGRGRAGMIGQGKNMWPNVHIDDTAQLYVLVLDSIVKGDPIGHGRKGFYFGENGEHNLYEVGKAVGEALLSQGKADNAEPTTLTKEEVDKYFGGSTFLTGSNSRCRANRSRSIGWKPRYTKEDFIASLKPEVEALGNAGRL